MNSSLESVGLLFSYLLFLVPNMFWHRIPHIWSTILLQVPSLNPHLLNLATFMFWMVAAAVLIFFFNLFCIFQIIKRNLRFFDWFFPDSRLKASIFFPVSVMFNQPQNKHKVCFYLGYQKLGWNHLLVSWNKRILKWLVRSLIFLALIFANGEL